MRGALTRPLVGFDLETHRIESGLLAPPVVCASLAVQDGRSFVKMLIAPGRTRAEKARGAVRVTREILVDDEYDVAGANVAYDFGCLVAEDPGILPLVFRAYERRRVHDVQLAQSLHAIARGDLGIDPRTGVQFVKAAGKEGRYTLERCVAFVLGREGAKANAEWRERYALLGDLPVEEWPESARVYPVDDAENTAEVALAQCGGGGGGATPGPHRNLNDLAAQCETAWALHLGAMWGVRADGDAVRELRARVERDHEAFVRRHSRFFKPCGKVDKPVVARAVAVAYAGEMPPCRSPKCVGGRTLSEKTGNVVFCKECASTGFALASSVPRTPAGGVQADKDALAESGDPDLEAFGENEPEKIKSTYLPWLELGVERPLTFRPNTLVASGRTSYDGLVQTMPREGGVRECLAARPGSALCSVDYAAIELVALSQFCLWVLGRSRMAEVIQETGDPGMLHTSFGARLAGWSIGEMKERLAADDKVAKNMRWAAKAVNFGKPGGLGSAKFVLTQRQKSAGKTRTPDGEIVYNGLRFCVLLEGGAALRRAEDVAVAGPRGAPHVPSVRRDRGQGPEPGVAPPVAGDQGVPQLGVEDRGRRRRVPVPRAGAGRGAAPEPRPRRP